MDKLKAMHTFVEIARAGSLTGAARRMGSSLPSVVRRLADLEGELGVRLFNRTTRKISLTREGGHYLEHCQAILSSIDEAESSLAAEQATPSGQLRVTAPVLFGQYYVAPAVTGFLQRYDQVRCQLSLNDRNIDLLEDQVDVGVRIGHLPDSTLIAHRVGEVRRVVVAAPAFLEKQGIPSHPRDLLRGNGVHVLSRWTPWTFREGEHVFTVPVTGNFDCNQIAPAIEACLSGLGFGMFLSYQVAHHVREGRLRILLADFEQPPRPVSVVYPHARRLPVRTRLFVDWIREALTSAGLDHRELGRSQAP